MGRVCLTGVGGWKSLTGRGKGPSASRQIGRRIVGTLNTGAPPDWHRRPAALTVRGRSVFPNLQASLSPSASALLAIRRHLSFLVLFFLFNKLLLETVPLCPEVHMRSSARRTLAIR
jgi:hypothetical protein